METETIKAPPTILVKLPTQLEMVPLPISETNVEIHIVGNFARTKMRIKFYNESERILEGQFIFPLLQGQSVSGYALEIDGKFKDAVVVQKAKGRQIFESTIRQKIDPGLLELTRGNVFQSRIYPIPAKGHKSIEVTFEQELELKENGWSYVLPFYFKEAMDHFSLSISIPNQNSKPISFQNSLHELTFQKKENSFRADFKAERFIANTQVGFLIPIENDQVKILTKKKDKEKNYFYFNLVPESSYRPKKIPSVICLLWDVSDSVKNRDINKEITLLEEYFQGIQNFTLEIVQFSFWIHSARIFQIQNGNIAEVTEYLKSIKYDGGTQLGALHLNKYACDEFLLVTDGISNFGDSEISMTSIPIYPINSSLTSEHSYLDYIAKKSGGSYINLTKMSLVDSLKILRNRVYSFLSATFSESSILEMYPSLNTVVSKDISFAGIMTEDNVVLTLNFGFGEEITHREKININAVESQSEDSFIDRIFAQKKISELDLRFKQNKEEITQIGKEFSIITRNTSLLVLDRIEDYVTYKIIPPIELQKEYFELLKNTELKTSEKLKSHLDEIAEKFQTQIDWWNKEFKYVKKDKSSKKLAVRERSLGSPAPEPPSVEPPEANEFLSSSVDMESDEAEETCSRESNITDDPEPVEAKVKSEKESSPTTASITLKKWSPDESYLNKLKTVSDKELYTIYLQEKESNSNSSAFYLDVSDFFLEKNQDEIALRILSNIAEMNLENHQLLRILGYRLLQIHQWKFAIKIFEDVLEIREEEPQSYRDLALACMGDKQYQRALDLFYSVIKKEWDSRFPDIQLIAIHEMNALIATCKTTLNLEQIDKRLLKNLPVDIRVILTWDADNTDLDLWVTDPNEEKCYYGQPETSIGGKMSQDFRAGYGPEEFMLKKAIPGKYKIEANYFGSTQQVLSGTTTLQVTLTTNFGRDNQEDKAITLRLKDVKEIVNVGEFEV